MADLIITGMSLTGGGMTFTLPTPAAAPITYYRWGFGDNSLGNGGAFGSTTAPDSSTVSSPVLLDSLSWSQLNSRSAWFTNSAIKPNGTLWTWGKNNRGQLGNETTTNNSSPVQTVASGTNWQSTSNGYNHTAAIKTDGTLWTWGRNTGVGQLGTNDTNHRSSPVQTVAGGTNWSQVSAGGYHNLAIKTDGTLWAWGQNYYGQLGDNARTHRSSPVQTIAGGTNWSQISGGWAHSAAIKTDGTLWAWGDNGYGHLGTNDTTHRSQPVQTVTGGTNWRQVSASQAYGTGTAAIKTDGTLWAWGKNNVGQLGDNTTINKSSPVQTIASGSNWSQVSAGGYHTAAIKTNGTLWAWGEGANGQLGDNTLLRKSSPVQTSAGGTNWANVTAGSYFTLALRTSAT